MSEYHDYGDGVKDEKKEDSIGSAGSLAHRSEKSHGKMSEMWEDDEELSGDEKIDIGTSIKTLTGE